MATEIEHDASGVYNYGGNPKLWTKCYDKQRCGYSVHRTVTIEPEPEKPREWKAFVTPNGNLRADDSGWIIGTQHVRVHDADACERLNGGLCLKRVSESFLCGWHKGHEGSCSVRMDWSVPK